jgi:hypothetical protein
MSLEETDVCGVERRLWGRETSMEETSVFAGIQTLILWSPRCNSVTIFTELPLNSIVDLLRFVQHWLKKMTQANAGV